MNDINVLNLYDLDVRSPEVGEEFFDPDLDGGTLVRAVDNPTYSCNGCIYLAEDEMGCHREDINCTSVMFVAAKAIPEQPRVTPVRRTSLTKETLQRAATAITDVSLQQIENDIKANAPRGAMRVYVSELKISASTVLEYFKDSPITVKLVEDILYFSWDVE